MASNTASDKRREVDEAVEDIASFAFKWLSYLIRQRRSGWRWVSFGAFVAVTFLSFDTMAIVSYRAGSVLNIALGGSIALVVGTVAGVIVYFYQKRRSSKDEVTKLSEVYWRLRDSRGSDVAGSALLLVEEVMKAMPLLKRELFQAAWGGAIAGFFVGAIIGNNLGVGLALAAAVWAYLRLEAERIYDKEEAKYDEIARRFREQKDQFMASL
jgi:hypothetical protein